MWSHIQKRYDTFWRKKQKDLVSETTHKYDRKSITMNWYLTNTKQVACFYRVLVEFQEDTNANAVIWLADEPLHNISSIRVQWLEVVYEMATFCSFWRNISMQIDNFIP